MKGSEIFMTIAPRWRIDRGSAYPNSRNAQSSIRNLHFIWKIAGRGVGEPCPGVWSWPMAEAPRAGRRVRLLGYCGLALVSPINGTCPGAHVPTNPDRAIAYGTARLRSFPAIEIGYSRFRRVNPTSVAGRARTRRRAWCDDPAAAWTIWPLSVKP